MKPYLNRIHQSLDQDEHARDAHINAGSVVPATHAENGQVGSDQSSVNESERYMTVEEYLSLIDETFRTMYIYPSDRCGSPVDNLLKVCRDCEGSSWDYVRYAEDSWVCEAPFEPAEFMPKGAPRAWCSLPESFEQEEWVFIEQVAAMFVERKLQGSLEPTLSEDDMERLDELAYRDIWI